MGGRLEGVKTLLGRSERGRFVKAPKSRRYRRDAMSIRRVGYGKEELGNEGEMREKEEMGREERRGEEMRGMRGECKEWKRGTKRYQCRGEGARSRTRYMKKRERQGEAGEGG